MKAEPWEGSAPPAMGCGGKAAFARRDRGDRACVATVVLVLVFVATPSVAWGLCPNCLGQSQFLTPTLKLLGIFLLVPFVVAFVVFRAIRRACDHPR